MTKQANLNANRSRLALLCCLCLSAVAWSACSAEDGGGGGDGNTGPVITNQGNCTTQYLTASCTCPDKGNIAGRQVCIASNWSACDCVAPVSVGNAGTGATDTDAAVGGNDGIVAGDPAGNKSPSRFNWERTPFELGTCKAGHYVGYFEGWYGSPAAFTAPVPVWSVPGADGLPGLEFWLEKIPGSGELFAINGGKIRGTADGLFPFTIDLTGTLDCKTKKFVGKLENGEYDVFGTKYQFEGNATADYDKLQNKFITGLWDAKEPTSPFPTAGGSGKWDAEWSAM